MSRRSATFDPGILAKEAGDAEYGRRLALHLAVLDQIDTQMHRLLSDLVDIVAIEAGILAIRARPHSAAELLLMATAVFEPLAQERGQSVLVTPAPADVTVMADPTRAIQVLGNLLSNAIKFTPADGKLRVGMEVAEDEVTFCVADTGAGVPAEQADRIFEPFTRSTNSVAGLGLGLFISKRLVDAHSGRLWFESDPAGGSVFASR